MELNTRNFTANTVDFMAGLRLKDTTGSKYGPNRKVCVCMGGGGTPCICVLAHLPAPKKFSSAKEEKYSADRDWCKKKYPEPFGSARRHHDWVITGTIRRCTFEGCKEECRNEEE